MAKNKGTRILITLECTECRSNLNKRSPGVSRYLTQKTSPISLNQKIDYKDIDLLSLFLTEQGKILPRRATGVTVQQQRKLTKAIKRARILSLLPFVASNEGNNK